MTTMYDLKQGDTFVYDGEELVVKQAYHIYGDVNLLLEKDGKLTAAVSVSGDLPVGYLS